MVILQTRELVAALFKSIADLQLYNVSSMSQAVNGPFDRIRNEQEEVFSQLAETIVNCLAYRETALLTLDYECMDIVKDALEAVDEDKIVELVNQLVRFGRHLFEELISSGAYRNGRLMYTYHDHIRNDVVLSHVEQTPPGFTIDHMRLQVFG